MIARRLTTWQCSTCHTCDGVYDNYSGSGLVHPDLKVAAARNTDRVIVLQECVKPNPERKGDAHAHKSIQNWNDGQSRSIP